MAESVIRKLSVGERAWIRRYARSGMPMVDLVEYASAKAGSKVSLADVDRFLNEFDGSTNGANPDPIAIISGGLSEVLKRLNPAEKAWIRIGYNRGKSPEVIAAGLTAKYGIRVGSSEVSDYLDIIPSNDDPLLPAEIHTIKDLSQRIADDESAEQIIFNICSETETTDRYIKPFFKLLGWDFQDLYQVKQNRFEDKGVQDQPQFDIHLGYADKARSIIVEAKRFSTKIIEGQDLLKARHQSQFEKYRKEPHRILVFTNGKELIAFDKDGPVLVIKPTDWVISFNEAKRLMCRSGYQ